MAISTNASIEFYGTQDTITGSGATVSDASFATAATTWTNDDDARYAAVVLDCSYTTTPAANQSVDLFLQLLNIQSTNDMEVPDADAPHVYAGSFPIATVTTQQYIPIEITLPNVTASQQYKFVIKNNAGQTMDSDWNLYVTPKSIGPHA